ncbi:MAG: peptidase [bacterium]|nr:peptidase [bacterium]
MILQSKRYKLTKILSAIISVILSALAIFFISRISFDLKAISILAAAFCGAGVFLVSYLFFIRKFRHRKKILSSPFPPEWEDILLKKVVYYSALDNRDKIIFQQYIQVFLGEKQITGIETDVDDICRVLVAASAIIPIFRFPEWEYDRLDEILIYPSNFDDDFSFSRKESGILGMVIGNSSAMILSKPALFFGFDRAKDKENVGIHEFIHKVDGEDGSIDGVPAMLADQALVKDWLRVMEYEMSRLEDGQSDINPYGLTNSAEFFAVVSEYFFENPAAMEKEHVEMYGILKKIFKQDTKSLFSAVLGSMFRPRSKKTGRNAPCPCGSGKKYKKCCLNKRV